MGGSLACRPRQPGAPGILWSRGSSDPSPKADFLIVADLLPKFKRSFELMGAIIFMVRDGERPRKAPII